MSSKTLFFSSILFKKPRWQANVHTPSKKLKILILIFPFIKHVGILLLIIFSILSIHHSLLSFYHSNKDQQSSLFKEKRPNFLSEYYKFNPGTFFFYTIALHSYVKSVAYLLLSKKLNVLFFLQSHVPFPCFLRPIFLKKKICKEVPTRVFMGLTF